jgi:predicted RNase H-like HicB family nuclease
MRPKPKPKPKPKHSSFRRFTIIPEVAEEGGYTGRCLELPGAISEGETLQELRANMTEAIKLTLEYLESKAAKIKRTQKQKQERMVIELPV